MKVRIILAAAAIFVLSIMLHARGSSQSQTQTDKPNESASSTTSDQWRVSEPLEFENLTIYPILSTKAVPAGRYITLDEGLRKGTVLVSEIGASGRAHRIGRGRRASDDDEVNRLVVTNRSGKTLLLIAGELVVGGNQDRIVGHDCLVASGRKRVPIDVFCVEHGRWSEDSAFGRTRAETIASSDSTASHGRRVRAGRGSNRSSGSSNAGDAEYVTVTAAREPGFFTSATEVMAPPNIREKAQAANDQTTVWAEVSRAETINYAVSATGTLNAVFEDTKVKTNLDSYERALRSRMPRNAVGIMAAINGEMISVDVFAAPVLFKAYWPKLLRSLALQATSIEEKKSDSPSLEAARAFLTRGGDTKPSETRMRLYKLVERKSDLDASFELKPPANQASEIIHFNKVAKH